VEGSGAGLILADQEGRETTYALRFNFPASNNESEYEALIAGLSLASRIGAKKLQAFGDSKQQRQLFLFFFFTIIPYISFCLLWHFEPNIFLRKMQPPVYWKSISINLWEIISTSGRDGRY
jgi:ribonuclease HI